MFRLRKLLRRREKQEAMFRLRKLLRRREKQEAMFRLRKRDWIILTAFIVAGAVGYVA
jgi:hypothetical protein